MARKVLEATVEGRPLIRRLKKKRKFIAEVNSIIKKEIARR